MASRYEQEPPLVKECENCSEKGRLFRCSRCRSVHFCSVACHKAYWPFHKEACRKNDFADAIEEQEPIFARWMRRHAKLAVVKDDEVDRLERASKATTGPSRQEVMDSMYGRLDPRPRGPYYTEEEQRAMALAASTRPGICWLDPQERAWQEVEVPEGLGQDCGSFRWRQTQSHVEAFFRLPHGTKPGQATVELRPQYLRVDVDGQVVLDGELLQRVQLDGSSWTTVDGILELSLLKANRRGRYQPGTTNADTFWQSVLVDAPPQYTLPSTHPPTAYYWSPYEDADGALAVAPAAPKLLQGKEQQKARQMVEEGKVMPPPMLLQGSKQQEGQLV